MLLLPPCSVISTRWAFPTREGSMCSYKAASFIIALTCTPPLWAKAAFPTKGCRRKGARLDTSETKAAVDLSRVREAPLRQEKPFIFTWRLGMTEQRLAFPQRSPMPFTVPCTWMAPLFTAARLLATASSQSLWAWMPRRACGRRSLTVLIMELISSGMVPPLVSHSTRQSAPCSQAVRSTARAYSGSRLKPSKKCSASKKASSIFFLRKEMELPIISRLRSREMPSASKSGQLCIP